MKSKKIIFVIFSIFIFFSIFIAALPSMLSTKTGQKVAIEIIKKKGYENFSAKHLKFSWFGPQKIEGLKLQSKVLSISASHFETSLNFWSFITLNKFNKSLISLNAKTILKHGTIRITHPDFPYTDLTNINGSVHTSDIWGSVNLSLSGESFISGKTGDFSILSSISRNENIGTVKLHNFPSVSLDKFIIYFTKEYKNEVSDILGEITNLEATYKIVNAKGPVDIEIASSNVQAKIAAYYSNSSITLQDSIKAHVTLTKTLSKYLFEDINPLLTYGVKAKNPVLIYIDPEGFYLPLDPFDIRSLRVGNAGIDLGKITTKNNDNIKSILAILQRHTLQYTDELNIWCSPIYIRIDNGMLYTSRMDALIADTIHICTWGNIDLNTNKIKMTLGLTPQVLKMAFGIRNLPPSYIMQIPMKGTVNNIKIDKKRAKARIAALLAKTTTSNNSNIGKVLDIVAGAADDQSKVPPPIRPYPWEK